MYFIVYIVIKYPSVKSNNHFISKIKCDVYTKKYVNLNSVALCFQAFILDQNEITRSIMMDPVYSHPINLIKK